MTKADLRLHLFIRRIFIEHFVRAPGAVRGFETQGTERMWLRCMVLHVAKECSTEHAIVWPVLGRLVQRTGSEQGEPQRVRTRRSRRWNFKCGRSGKTPPVRWRLSTVWREGRAVLQAEGTVIAKALRLSWFCFKEDYALQKSDDI